MIDTQKRCFSKLLPCIGCRNFPICERIWDGEWLWRVRVCSTTHVFKNKKEAMKVARILEMDILEQQVNYSNNFFNSSSNSSL